MNTVEELKKIVAILEQKKFIYKGSQYSLDVEATNNSPINSNLVNKPLMKLIGNDGTGNIVMVWSHDCSEVESDFTLSASDLASDLPAIEVYVVEVQSSQKKFFKSKKKK